MSERTNDPELVPENFVRRYVELLQQEYLASIEMLNNINLFLGTLSGYMPSAWMMYELFPPAMKEGAQDIAKSIDYDAQEYVSLMLGDKDVIVELQRDTIKLNNEIEELRFLLDENQKGNMRPLAMRASLEYLRWKKNLAIFKSAHQDSDMIRASETSRKMSQMWNIVSNAASPDLISVFEKRSMASRD